MVFEVHVLKYLEVTPFSDWSILGIMQYLSENVSYTSASYPEIRDVFLRHMQIRSTNNTFTKAVQRKAVKICENLTSTQDRPEVKEFLKVQDLKHAEVSYKKCFFGMSDYKWMLTQMHFVEIVWYGRWIKHRRR